MIGKNNQENHMNISELQYVIVYDKFTKPAAISLKNKLSKDARCISWSKKDFQAAESSITNKTNIIFLNEDLIKENLANPNLTNVQIIPGIDYKKEGNVLGLLYNEDTSPIALSDILKGNWVKYVMSTLGPIIFVGGIPGAAIISFFLTRNEKNKIKIKLYMDAVEKLSSTLLKKLYNG